MGGQPFLPGQTTRTGRTLTNPCGSTTEKLIEARTHDPNKFAVDSVHCTSGIAINAQSIGGTAVNGFAAVEGVHGESTSGTGIAGMSDTGYGLFGQSRTGVAVFATSQAFEAVHAESHFRGGGTIAAYNLHNGEGFAIYGKKAGGAGHAGFFDGTVWVSANMGVGRDVEVFGNIIVHGDISLTSADCAEDFDIAGPDVPSPGTVMVLADDLAICPSSAEYDRRVAGVICGAGDYKPGIKLDRQKSDVPRVSLALAGKVFCKVDAAFGAIEIGDLLTTSPSIGHAMRVRNASRGFGAVLGKALRAHAAGKGLIPILVALQ